VEHGFRLPSALDNRPLKFDEFMQMTNQRVYISATPGPFEFINSRPDNKKYIPWKRGEISAAQALKQIRKTITPSGADQDVENFRTDHSTNRIAGSRPHPQTS